jgi:hypothetical protein
MIPLKHVLPQRSQASTRCGSSRKPPALPAPQACSGGHAWVLSRFRKNLPIQRLKARVPLLGSSPFLREAPSATHSKLRCVLGSFAVHHLRRRVVPLEACSSPARSPTSGTRRSEKITATDPKISASSELGNSDLRVPHVGARVKCGGRRAAGVARLRVWNSEVAWVDALHCHEFMAMESDWSGSVVSFDTLRRVDRVASLPLRHGNFARS